MRRLVPLVFLGACTREEPAGTLLTGGTIHVDVATTTDALAFTDGEIVAIGADALDREGKDTRVVDLGGAHAFPGFQDAHVHLLAGSFALDRLLLLGISSMDRLTDKVTDYAAEAPADEPWLIGYGWLEIPDPTGVPITAAVPDRPVLLVSNSGHQAIVNQAALDAAGIDRDTPDPQGGLIARDENGDPTGYLSETAVELVSDLVLDAYDDDRLAAALPAKLEEFSASGLTGVHEILAVPGFAIGRPWVYAELEAAGTLPLRVSWYAPAMELDDLAEIAAMRDAYDGELVRFAGAKVWVDGSMGSVQAWVEEPYEVEPFGTGAQYFTPEQLTAIVAEAEALEIPLKMHVNGDAAIDAALDALEANAPLDQQHVFDHATLMDPDDYARIHALGVVVSMQPTHYAPASFGDTADALGERWEHAYDLRGVADEGIPLALGTDWPVWPSQQPLLVTWSAATAQDEESLTPAEAVRGYTEGSAAALGRSADLGRLDVGYAADFVVLGGDPLTTSVDAIPDVPVQQVWVAGRQVR